MDEAEVARTAAREAVGDITPGDLRDVIDDLLSDASMVPGALTVLSANALTGPTDDDAVAQRAAGVQLIYEGLRLTRHLVETEPWQHADPDRDLPADLDVLAADVLVARGFRLLAHTEAAGDAVATVREFGRHETDREHDRASDARTLETTVFELGVVAGATATGTDTPLDLRRYAIGLARSNSPPPLASADDLLPDTIEDVLQRVSTPRADDTAKPRSATDP
ncbi:hypothetical protein U3A55_05500 [Salarchaeum sp. III]|uniref:DUF7114 family protein n=1 Tax=Salarchaeum sp. III TaxID=3107927 RepID=UPI002EDAADF2